jgi:SAM-dependent methyltransferase
MGDQMHTEVWQSLGEQDPDWAVVSTPGKEHGGWLTELDRFYAEGRDRVSEALALLPSEPHHHRALDWGSGTGRLSFALRQAGFERVTCVDISTTMLERLAERAEERDIDGLDLTVVSDFTPQGDHDLALSLITLQHFPSRATVAAAVESMMASLRIGGYLVIEIPLRPHTLRYRIQPRLQVYRALRKVGVNPKWLHAHGLSGISMLCIPSSWVVDLLERGGMQLLQIRERRGTSHQMAHYAAVRTA